MAISIPGGTQGRLIPSLLLGMAVSGGVLAETKPWPGRELTGKPCSGGGQGFGPYDYTNPEHRDYHLTIVEKHHFFREVEQLISGPKTRIVGDLDYTIRAFPNHHRALNAMIRYARSNTRGTRPPLKSRPECYLQRALAFKPNDGVVHLLFASYLHRFEHPTIDNKDAWLGMAKKHYQRALELKPKMGAVHYNIGLLYLDTGEFELARKHAREAIRLRYPLAGLRDKLREAGHPLEH